MPQTRYIIAKTVKPHTKEQWREIWLEKLIKSCAANGIKDATTAGFVDFVSKYMAPYSCHPGKIPKDAVPEFIAHNSKTEKQTKFCRDALTFFYENVVKSESHLEVLWNYSIPKPLESPKPDETVLIAKIIQKPIPKISEKKPEELFESIVPGLLKSLRDELKVRNYSKRTIENYGAAVNQYLHWLKNAPSGKDVPEIKKFQLYLKPKIENCLKATEGQIWLFRECLIFVKLYQQMRILHIPVGLIGKMLVRLY
jgi:hypothetical protein